MEVKGHFVSFFFPLYMHFSNVGNKINCTDLYQRQSVTAEGEVTLLHTMFSFAAALSRLPDTT